MSDAPMTGDIPPEFQGSQGAEDSVLPDDPRQTWVVYDYVDDNGKPQRKRVKTEAYLKMDR